VLYTLKSTSKYARALQRIKKTQLHHILRLGCITREDRRMKATTESAKPFSSLAGHTLRWQLKKSSWSELVGDAEESRARSLLERSLIVLQI
jgi:hypothetical protein